MFSRHTATKQCATLFFLSALALPVCHASHAIDVAANAVYHPKTVVQIPSEEPVRNLMALQEKHHLTSYYQLISTKRRYQNKKEKKKNLINKKRLLYVGHKPDQDKGDAVDAVPHVSKKSLWRDLCMHLTSSKKIKLSKLRHDGQEAQDPYRTPEHLGKNAGCAAVALSEADGPRVEVAPEMKSSKVADARAKVETTSAAMPPEKILPNSAKDRLLPLEISVNSAPTGQWLLLERNGVLYASEDAFKNWRLQREKAIQTIQAHKITWFPLSSLPGFNAKFNDENQSVILTFASDAFIPTTVESEQAAPLKMMPASLAAFANYDLSFTASRAQSDSGVSSKKVLPSID